MIREGEDVRTGPDKTLIDVTILIIMHGVQTFGHFQEKRHNNVKTMSVTFERAGNGNKMSKLKTKLIETSLIYFQIVKIN